jgi:hypothetical protein
LSAQFEWITNSSKNFGVVSPERADLCQSRDEIRMVFDAASVTPARIAKQPRARQDPVWIIGGGKDIHPIRHPSQIQVSEQVERDDSKACSSRRFRQRAHARANDRNA